MSGSRPAAPLRVSLLSPPGRGALAVLSLRGSDLAASMPEFFDGRLIPGGASHGRLRDRTGEILDDGLCLGVASDEALLTLHGSPLIVDRVLADLEARGWTRDAAGVSPLAVDRELLLLAARAPSARSGSHLLAQARAWDAFLARSTPPTREELVSILGRRRAVSAFERPPTIALLGAPNAGKSTLLNRLLGAERVVTSERPGTTRDRIEAPGVVADRPVRWVDGAGIRRSGDALEAEGVRRMLTAAASADLVLLLVPRDGAGISLPAECTGPVLRVGTKADLPGSPPEAVDLQVSAREGEGLAALRGAVATALFGGEDLPEEVAPLTAARAEALQGLLEASGATPSTECIPVSLWAAFPPALTQTPEGR